MEPEAIARRIWRDAKLELEPLGGGITNRNFKITVDGSAYVLRIGGKDTALLGIDRDVEHQASCAAAALGIAPEVVAFVEPEGHLITRFVEGAPAGVEAMHHEERLRWVAAALRSFHHGPWLDGRFDSFRVVEAYAATAAANGVEPPLAYERAKPTADEIERRLGPRHRRPCHNDLLNANFILDGSRLWLVDWEYAGMGDVSFDLANFSINHQLDAHWERFLLEQYGGKASVEDVAALTVMKFMSDFREAMWGVVQQGISELDFDFRGYAEEHFKRLERTARDSVFRTALDAL